MESDVNYPLLVKIQAVNLQNLDFKTTGSQKTRNVTCLEASNLYIFVGCASGTVFVFSRETLLFRFMIPFKGGKVCSISCADNERDLAVGSIRGKVSIYQIVPQSGKAIPASATSHGAFFKNVHTVNHHSDNEITELHWSPNGRYLFIGDSQGLVSQVDVGGYEEFPRPVSPSQVILKLKSRIIQLDFIFPYLATCTVSSVYLCDVEDEDFVRVQLQPKKDIRASGVALILTVQVQGDPNSNTSIGALYLYVSDMTSGFIHCFNMQGLLIESKQVSTSSVLVQDSVTAFDPVRTTEGGAVERCGERADPLTVSLGKIYISDENLLVSVSHDHLYIIEPKDMSLILWTEEFSRIQSLKLISNYVFVWNAGKLDVISLTQFRPYAEQLFKSGVTQVLQRWVEHVLQSLGWRKTEAAEEHAAAAYFRSLLGTNFTEEDDFAVYISKQVPFRIFEDRPLTPPAPVNPLLSPVTRLLSAIKHEYFADAEDELERTECSRIVCVWKAVRAFYAELNLFPCPQSENQSLTLTKVMLGLNDFFNNACLVSLPQELLCLLPSKSLSLLEEAISTLIHNLLHALNSSPDLADMLNEPLETSSSSGTGFISFVKLPFIQQWFLRLGISEEELKADAVVADMLSLFTPLLSTKGRLGALLEVKKNHDLKSRFFSWLVCSTVCNFDQRHPYGTRLSSLFSKQSRKFHFVQDVFCSVYRDIVQPDIQLLSSSLHHFVSVIFLILKGKKLEKSLKTPSNFLLTLLVSCFPLQHWPKPDIEKKIIGLCNNNPILFKMFQEACLAGRSSVAICQCGIPRDCALSATDSSPLPHQRVTQEAILEILIQRHLTLSDEEATLKQSSVFQFAMQTGLYQQLLTDLSHEVDDDTYLELILRTSSCALLEKLRLSRTRVNLLLEKQEYLLTHTSCQLCGDQLTFSPDFELLSYDCIGIWILRNAGSLERFAAYLQKTAHLNTPGRFSMEFYLLILQWNDETSGGNSEESANALVPLSKLSCSSMHLASSLSEPVVQSV